MKAGKQEGGREILDRINKIYRIGEGGREDQITKFSRLTKLGRGRDFDRRDMKADDKRQDF